ncbi:hypothetical protein ACGFZQ_41790 [Streptomyces sp. NPDC048254]|uniref:hypothetical protein n=1 Tax=Streptomyces sp. NPDC048254 TaxID=3365525 RepID=UPI00371E7F1A
MATSSHGLSATAKTTYLTVNAEPSGQPDRLREPLGRPLDADEHDEDENGGQRPQQTEHAHAVDGASSRW